VEEPVNRESSLVRGGVVGKARRLQEIVAPSWSWASLDASIKYDLNTSYHSFKSSSTLVGVQTSGNDSLARFKGEITVTGGLTKVFMRCHILNALFLTPPNRH
jgi:hypothetical protein